MLFCGMHLQTTGAAIYFYFTPSHSGARVQRVTEQVAEQVASLLTYVCHGLNRPS